jgi:2-oxoisovalerate dehydrogenase E2 component (dihydrolipoyl transacylase)
MLAVGSELIRIEVEDAAGAMASKATPAPAPASAPAPAPAPVALQASPVAPLASESTPTSTRAVAPAAPAVPALPRPPTPASTSSAQRPIASPAVRARAWELGVDLRDVTATGSAGRIVQVDLDAHVARGGARTKPVSASRAAATSDATHEVKIVGLRRKIAQKMQESKRRIPHYTYVEEVDVTEIEALRAALNDKWGNERGRLTLLAFLVRAVVLAVREFPMVNARFDDEAGVLTRHDAVHVGIATQTPAGLVVPVVRDAQANDLWSNAAEIARLADAARSGKAVRAELTGSTITITSLGKLGGIVTTPVINHPEVAIVGVNKIAARPVIRDGAVVARQLMNLSSSFDHRVVDGADAAAFIQSVRRYVEQPAMLFVE